MIETKPSTLKQIVRSRSIAGAMNAALIGVEHAYLKNLDIRTKLCLKKRKEEATKIVLQAGLER